MIVHKPRFSQATPRTRISEHRGESFVFAEASKGLTFDESLRLLFQDYQKSIDSKGLSGDTEVYIRFYLSDITNQSVALRQQLLRRQAEQTAYSFVGQAPASGSKVSLIAYHLRSPRGAKAHVPDGSLVIDHGSYKSVWSTDRAPGQTSSYEQTDTIFQSLEKRAEKFGGSVASNLLRTWCYIRDIDNNYQGFVDAREWYFRSIGLNSDTHFIASTGIEGQHAGPADLVAVESLAMYGLEDEQIEYMEAPEHLCPTHEYNVSFERATRVVFGDRSHYYVSGTASIDKHGQVVHVGHVLKQADRTLRNISALLEPYGARLEDMRCLTVYLRDLADYEKVQEFLNQRLPADLPYVIVRGSVCRPTWLIEMEGIAISSMQDESFAPYLPQK